MAVIRPDQQQNPSISLDEALNANPQPTGTPRNNPSTDWSNLEDIFDISVNTAPGSEILNQATTVIQKEMTSLTERVQSRIGFDFLPLDRESNVHLSHSVLVFLFSIKDRPELGLSYHAMIIDGSVTEDDVRYENLYGQNIEVRRLVSDAYDGRMRSEIRRAVENHAPGKRIVSADASVLPRGFDLDNELAVRRITGNVLLAARNILQMSARDWADLDITQVSGSYGLTSSVKFNRNGDQARDDANLPVRSDVLIDLQTREVRNQHEQVRSKKLAQISGYVDLTYSPSQAPVGFGQQVRGALYLPRFIVTHLDATSLRSVGGQLLALLSTMALYQNNTALASLYPNTSIRKEAVDMHDIGNLNWEANIAQDQNGGSYWDLKGANISPEDISTYLGQLLHPTFELAMDVSNCGADTWLNSVFARASGGGGKKDYDRIVSAANRLTNGAFSRYFKEGTPIVKYESEVPLGYYHDHNGNPRDIRDVDYLAVLGACGGKDLTPLYEWHGAKYNPAIDSNVGLAIQRRVTESVLGSNVTYTGYASRFVFNQAFLVALTNSAAEAGLVLQTQIPNSGQTQQRFVYQPTMEFNSQQIVGSLFANPYQQQNFGAQGQARWNY